MNPLYIYLSYSLRHFLNFILPFTLWSSKWHLSFRFSSPNLSMHLFSPTRATCPYHLIFFDLIIPVISFWLVGIVWSNFRRESFWENNWTLGEPPHYMSKIFWEKKYCRRHNLYIVHRLFQGVSYFPNQRLSRYRSKCNYIFAHKQITAFPAPLFTKPSRAQQHYVSSSYTNLHP